MTTLKRLQTGIVVLAVLVFGMTALAVPQPADAAKKRIKKVPSVEVGYTKKGKKVRIQWEGRKNANRYKVQVKKGKTLVKEFTTKKKKVTMKLGKYTDSKLYTVRVRAMKTKKKKASTWRKVKFRYYEPLRFETAIENPSINGSMWLFAHDDDKGDGTIMFSSEQPGQGLLMARGELENSNSLTWETIFSTEDAGGLSIADHWHIYAHGYHWISLSASSATKSYLLKVDKNMNLIDSTVVAEDIDITVPTGSTRLPTNDMMLVEEPNGVTVGHFYPAHGQRLFRFNTDLELQETKDIGGGDYVHGNSSTALPIDGGFMLLAIDTINNVAHSKLQRMIFDKDWNEVSVDTLVNLDSTNISMPNGVFTEDGYLIVTARVDEGAYPEGEMPPPPENGGNVGAPEDDSAGIWRFVFSPNKKNTLISRVELQEEGANRPHASIVDDQLVVIWDGDKGMTVDEIVQ